MTRAKFPIYDSVTKVPEGASYIILIRHGDRNQIRDGTHGNDCLLNESGRKKSINFGRTILSGLNVKFLSSPVERCIQTAMYMLEGLGQHQNIEISNVLGAPGPFVYDSSVGGHYFIEHGTIPTVMDLLDGVVVPGIRSVSEGSKILDEMFDKCLLDSKLKCNILITHDAIVTPYIYYHTGERFDNTRWIDFLDGTIVYLKDGKKNLIRNGQTFQLPGAVQ